MSKPSVTRLAALNGLEWTAVIWIERWAEPAVGPPVGQAALIHAVRGGDRVLLAEGGEAGAESRGLRPAAGPANDRAFDGDAVIVDRRLEAGNEVRLPHDTHFRGLRPFGFQQPVAFVDLRSWFWPWPARCICSEVVVDATVQARRPAKTVPTGWGRECRATARHARGCRGSAYPRSDPPSRYWRRRPCCSAHGGRQCRGRPCPRR